MRKKVIAWMLCMAVILSSAVGCGSSSVSSDSADNEATDVGSEEIETSAETDFSESSEGTTDENDGDDSSVADEKEEAAEDDSLSDASLAEEDGTSRSSYTEIMYIKNDTTEYSELLKIVRYDESGNRLISFTDLSKSELFHIEDPSYYMQKAVYTYDDYDNYLSWDRFTYTDSYVEDVLNEFLYSYNEDGMMDTFEWTRTTNTSKEGLSSVSVEEYYAEISYDDGLMSHISLETMADGDFCPTLSISFERDENHRISWIESSSEESKELGYSNVIEIEYGEDGLSKKYSTSETGGLKVDIVRLASAVFRILPETRNDALNSNFYSLMGMWDAYIEEHYDEYGNMVSEDGITSTYEIEYQYIFDEYGRIIQKSYSGDGDTYICSYLYDDSTDSIMDVDDINDIFYDLFDSFYDG